MTTVPSHRITSFLNQKAHAQDYVAGTVKQYYDERSGPFIVPFIMIRDVQLPLGGMR